MKLRSLVSIACLLITAACSSSEKKVESVSSGNQPCVSPLPVLLRQQLKIFRDPFPHRFAVYNFIIPKDEASQAQLKGYGILSVFFYTQNRGDLSLISTGSRSAEKKSFYRYPSVFEFPILKNAGFRSQSGKNYDYLEQDIHVLFPIEHLDVKSVWEIEMNGGNGKVPLFESPLEGVSFQEIKKSSSEQRPNLTFAAEMILDTYCILPEVRK